MYRYFGILVVLVALFVVVITSDRSNDYKRDQFLECSKDFGDWGCDSCYHAVYGVWAEDPGYLNYREYRGE